ncbi:MAG: OsmC family protein, partial [Gammaproteobacteria bacterium]
LWCRREQNFVDGRYSRKHVLRFDGGIEVAGSASPHVVPLPYSATDAIDPEEAFVSSLSSCHMLWFLSMAASQGFIVDKYHDVAEGKMEKHSDGKLMISLVTLRPAVKFSGDRHPTSSELERLHHEAHDRCFIANSVRSEVRCVPRQDAL